MGKKREKTESIIESLCIKEKKKDNKKRKKSIRKDLFDITKPKKVVAEERIKKARDIRARAMGVRGRIGRYTIHV